MGQSVANIATGFIGGMAGCGTIGESVINVKSGGRERLFTLVAVMMVVSIAPSTGRRSGTCGSIPRVQASSCWRRWRGTASGR